MGDVPLAAADRIIRDATGLRVGNDAAQEMSSVLEEIGATLSREAGEYARHAGRKTVKASDVKLARKRSSV